jgi:hypothetical protein
MIDYSRKLKASQPEEPEWQEQLFGKPSSVADTAAPGRQAGLPGSPGGIRVVASLHRCSRCMQQGAFQGIARHFTTGGTRAMMQRLDERKRRQRGNDTASRYLLFS